MRRSGSRATEHAVGESRQRPPLAFVPEENILSICNNKNDTMLHVKLLSDNNCYLCMLLIN